MAIKTGSRPSSELSTGLRPETASTTSLAEFHTAVAELRQRRFHPGRPPLASAEDTLDWIDQAGFCLLLPHEGVTLPNLAEISEGSYRLRRDRLMMSKQVYYGHPFQRQAGFVSLELFPALYALSPIAKYHGDRFELYRQRLLGADANRVTGIVLAKGPLSTRTLRRESGMAGQRRFYRFRRALLEAESRFLIAKVGIGRIKETRYTCLWDALPRYLPQSIEQASALSIEQAAQQIATRYVDLAGAATARDIERLFTLNPDFVRYILNRFTAEGVLKTVVVSGIEYVISPDLSFEP